MRELYETKEDLNNEDKVKQWLSRMWNVNIYKMPMSYKLDFCLEKNDNKNGKPIVAFAEIKCRTTPIQKYPTYIISLAKVIAGKQLALHTNTKPLLIVSWTDDIKWINMNEDFKCVVGGRRDRNDWQDIEPLCEFDINKFNEIKSVR